MVCESHGKNSYFPITPHSMKKESLIQYAYFVRPISENNTQAYEAIIPAFDNAVVFGDTLAELEKGVRFTIASEIAERKKEKRPIPPPEKSAKFSGKILLRMNPYLHEKIALEAQASGKSINRYIEEQLH